MSVTSTVTFYLHPKLRKQAEKGKHNFIARICDVLVAAGMDVAYDKATEMARIRALARPGRSIFLMEKPVNARGLTMRRTYIGPFWRIETAPERWNWPVAQAAFDANAIDPEKAANFYRFWQKRLYDDVVHDTRRDGFIFVPLQGHLTTRRSFQHASPIDMIRAILRHDPSRPVIATLHPSVSYPPEEQEALEALAVENDRLFIRKGDAARYLRTCDYVVTQNSSTAFHGYFFGKPAILFGKTDFHHIALKVAEMGEQAAFDTVLTHRPDYAAYLYWFLQMNAINAGRPEAQDQIATVLRGHGWPV